MLLLLLGMVWVRANVGPRTKNTTHMRENALTPYESLEQEEKREREHTHTARTKKAQTHPEEPLDFVALGLGRRNGCS